MQVAFVALDSAPYRIGVAVSQWQKHDLFHLINPIGVVDTYDTPNASVSVFSAMSADALKMLSSQKRLFGNSGWNSGTDFPAFSKMEGVRSGLAGFLHTLPHRPRQAPLCAPGCAPVSARRAPKPPGSPAVHPAVPQL